LDADGGRRWVIQGCAAEAAHWAAGGKVFGSAPGTSVTNDNLGASPQRGEDERARIGDSTYGEEYCAKDFVDFGFDTEGFDEFTMQDEEHLQEAFAVPPSPPAEPPPADDGDLSHETAAPSSLSSTATGYGAAAQTGLATDNVLRADQAASEGDTAAPPDTWSAAVSSGAKRRRLTGKTSPARAAELGHSDAHPVGLADDEELVTQAAAAAARTRNRGILLAHRRRVKAARDQAWATLARQPERSVHGELGTAAGSAPDEDLPVLSAPSVPRCWAAHDSHDLAAPTRVLLYCRRCGAWSGGLRTRGLALACRGPVGQPNSLRLLSLGIAPVKGARVPQEFKAAGSRGTRGGANAASGRRRRRSS
jgi:hypothetical protein